MKIRFEEEQKREKRIKFLKEALVFLLETGIVILAAYLIVHFALKRAGMVGSSMEPTLYNGEDVIINKTSFILFQPDRDAVIAFYPEQIENSGDDSSILIRRIVGLPGEKVEIKDGKIFIDENELKEKYDFGQMPYSDTNVTLSEDEYFVLCDNRIDTDDSRNTSFTKVKKDKIIGRVILALNPFSLVGGPESGQEEEQTEDSQ